MTTSADRAGLDLQRSNRVADRVARTHRECFLKRKFTGQQTDGYDDDDDDDDDDDGGVDDYDDNVRR